VLIRKFFNVHELFKFFIICDISNLSTLFIFSAFGIFSTLGVFKVCEMCSCLMVSEKSLSVFATFYFCVYGYKNVKTRFLILITIKSCRLQFVFCNSHNAQFALSFLRLWSKVFNLFWSPFMSLSLNRLTYYLR